MVAKSVNRSCVAAAVIQVVVCIVCRRRLVLGLHAAIRRARRLRGIMHRDFKPPKLGNLMYTAPEAFLPSGYDHRSDIYSYGLTIYYTFYGRHPCKARDFKGMSALETAIALKDDSRRPPLSSKPIDYLIERCWRGEPAERMPLQEILVLLDGPGCRVKFPRLADE